MRKKTMSRLISLRLDEDLFERITKEAEAAQIPRGEYIRRMLTKGKVRIRQEVVAPVPELKAILAQLGKIGSNINQIAHYYNGGGSENASTEAELQNALGALATIKYTVLGMGGDFKNREE